MASFTEYVKLIAEAGQVHRELAKLNAAIIKLREQAKKPIDVKFNIAGQKTAAGQQQIVAANHKAVQQMIADHKAIKAMNAEQGGLPHNVRFGSSQSLAQGRKFNEHLEESTKQINKLGDAYKHVKQAAAAAGIAITPKLAYQLAKDTVRKSDSAEAAAIKAAVVAQKELNKNKMDSIRLNMKLKENNAKIEADAGGRAQVAIEKEIISAEKQRIVLVRERNAQEEEGARRVIAMERERIREEKEASRFAKHANEGGLRGMGHEFARDMRRNSMYGVIGRGEDLANEGWKANVERSTVIENLREAGRTSLEIDQYQTKAMEGASKYKNLTVSELMTAQQHARGATGNQATADALFPVMAAYVSLRKNKVGEEAALSENLANLKVGEETGNINNKSWMKRLYDTQARVAQVEGDQYHPESFISTVRMLKSAKFNVSDEMMFGILPYLNIAEGAGRAGNEVAQLFKSLTYAGKSISKQNAGQIAGTIFSDGKGGYNPEISQKLAKGDLVGLVDVVDTFLKQKGLDPKDLSKENKTKEMNALAKSIGNGSAREALISLVENIDQFHKQQRAQRGAGGLDAATGLETRSLKTAQDAVEAGFKNFATAVLSPMNDSIFIPLLNKVADLENYSAQHPGKALLGGAAIAATGIASYIISNPGQAANTTALWANTAAQYKTSGIGAGGSILGGKGKGLGLLGAGLKGGLGVAAIVLAGEMFESYLDADKSGADTNSFKGIAAKVKKDIQSLIGLNKDETTPISLLDARRGRSANIEGSGRVGPKEEYETHTWSDEADTYGPDTWVKGPHGKRIRVKGKLLPKSSALTVHSEGRMIPSNQGGYRFLRDDGSEWGPDPIHDRPPLRSKSAIITATPNGPFGGMMSHDSPLGNGGSLGQRNALQMEGVYREAAANRSKLFDSISSEFKGIGTSVSSTVSSEFHTVTGAISGGGNAIAGALEAIAGRIAGIAIPNSVGNTGINNSKGNSGPHQRGHT